MLIGPAATDEEGAGDGASIVADPRGYIAQEVVSLSRHPTLVGDHLEGRHIDLRPFVLSGETRRGDPRRADPRRAAPGIARRELEPGRRLEGHVGAGGLMRLSPLRRGSARRVVRACYGPPTCWQPTAQPGREPWARDGLYDSYRSAVCSSVSCSLSASSARARRRTQPRAPSRSSTTTTTPGSSSRPSSPWRSAPSSSCSSR